jgi:hypothetical protein
VLLISSLALANKYARHVSVLTAEDHAAGQRQESMTRYMAAVSAQAETIDNHFLWYEGLLEGLSAAATYAFSHGTL